MNLSRRSIFLFVATLLALVPRISQAQIQKDTTHWNDEDLYVEDKGAPSFFSVGGGIMGAYFKPDFSTFNPNVAVPFTKQTYREQVWMVGGQGFVTLPWVKNLRVGGMAYSGVSTDCGCGTDTVTDPHTGANATVNRFMDYEIGYGAMTIDYVLPLRTGRFHIVPGVALGFGSVNIFARQAANRLNFTLDDFNGSSLYTTHTYTSHFFLYMPQLQFEWAPLGYMMFRLTAAYQGTSMGAWSVDRNVELGNTDPLTGINGSGIVGSLGVFVGIFQ